MSDNQYIHELSRSNAMQGDFESYLEMTYGKASNAKYLVEVNVAKSFEGILDLGIMATKFPSLEYLYFTQKGRITRLLNIPKKLKHLYCHHQLLVDIDHLPESLEILSVSNNVLSKLSLFTCNQLKTLHCEHNRISVLSGLPKSLENLYCNNNNLVLLDLINTPKLKVFHHHNNRQLVLKNVPTTVTDGFQYVQHAMMMNFQPMEALSDEYINQVHQYFEIKNKYEITLKNLRRKNGKKKMILPNCVGCKKAVGMVFSIKDRKYSAYCGANPPCPWKMVVHRGFYHPLREILDSYENTIDGLEQSSIQRKMDTMFHHMEEEKALALAKDEMAAYQTATEFYKTKKEIYDNYYFSEEKQEHINNQLREIHLMLQEVKDLVDSGEYNTAVGLEQKIAGFYHEIQSKEYEVMETMREAKTGRVRLFQEPVHYSKLEINLRETPKVGEGGTEGSPLPPPSINDDEPVDDGSSF